MRTYAVTWRDEGKGLCVGKLELRATEMTLDGIDGDGAAVSDRVDYADFRVRPGGERLHGRRAVVLDRTHGSCLLIASLDRPGTAFELAGLLAAGRAPA